MRVDTLNIIKIFQLIFIINKKILKIYRKIEFSSSTASYCIVLFVWSSVALDVHIKKAFNKNVFEIQFFISSISSGLINSKKYKSFYFIFVKKHCYWLRGVQRWIKNWFGPELILMIWFWKDFIKKSSYSMTRTTLSWLSNEVNSAEKSVIS